MQVSVFITEANPLCRKDYCEEEVWSCIWSVWHIRALNKCYSVALSLWVSWWGILCARWARTSIWSKLDETNSSWHCWCWAAPHLCTPWDTNRVTPLLLSHLRISQVDSQAFSDGSGNAFRNICTQQYRKLAWLFLKVKWTAALPLFPWPRAWLTVPRCQSVGQPGSRR